MSQLTIVTAAQPLPVDTARLRVTGRPPGSRSTLLEGLARELDLPVEAFFTDSTRAPDDPGAALDADAGELLALVRHWLAIGDGQARRRVLSLARQEAERSGLRACA